MIALVNAADTVTVDSCSSEAHLTGGTGTTDYWGGGVGANLGILNISNCIAKSTVDAGSTTNLAAITYFGGFVGGGGSAGSTFDNCIAITGPWSGASTHKEGFVGFENACTVTDCYWDTTVAGHTTAASGLGTAATTAELQTGSLSGFGSSKWNQASGEYPSLSFGLQTYGTGGGSSGATYKGIYGN